LIELEDGDVVGCDVAVVFGMYGDFAHLCEGRPLSVFYTVMCALLEVRSIKFHPLGMRHADRIRKVSRKIYRTP
jgi:hypothetical protein